jgi:hypothetical protein
MDERNDMPENADSNAPAANANGLSPFYGTAKDVVARYTHCALCGANLHFTHVTDFSRNLTQETARCPECGVKARQAMHRLQ